MDYSRVAFENAGEVCDGSAPDYAFVGLYGRGTALVFRLPIGYPAPAPDNHYAVARDLHIAFFKLFRRFRSIAQSNLERVKKTASAHEDAGPALDKGREWITRHEQGDVYYYRHFDAFDCLLDAFDELKILALARRLRLTEGAPADLRNFQQMDAGRIYQNDDSFYDDLSLQPLPTVMLLSSDLVGLYCYLLRDLREHIWAGDDPNPLQHDILVLADSFEEKHLWPNASCWEAAQWEATRDALREKLDIIDRMTALKDDDYYQLFEALERFLYPPTDKLNQEGKLWGLDGYWPVWEWMVLTRLATSPDFLKRLLWIEVGNLAAETVDALKKAGFRYADRDRRVLCRAGESWNTFLQHGCTLGHPYPDAIMLPAEYKPVVKDGENPDWTAVDELRLEEGPVSISLSGMSEHLAVSTATPRRARMRGTVEHSPASADEHNELKPVLTIAGAACTDLDRPEVIAMLRRLGKWEQDDEAFGRFKPFKLLKEVGRKHMDGLLLVDAKYKKPDDPRQHWANDHRKQAAYEDALTIACPGMPAAYSVYVCPVTSATKYSLENLKSHLQHFSPAFDAQWDQLPDHPMEFATLKKGGRVITVFGKNTVVAFSGQQRSLAIEALRKQLETDLAAMLLALSLLGAERFAEDDNFFVKNWPIRDLMELTLGAN